MKSGISIKISGNIWIIKSAFEYILRNRSVRLNLEIEYPARDATTVVKKATVTAITKLLKVYLEKFVVLKTVT